MKPVIIVLVVFYKIKWISEYNYYAAKSVYVHIITTHSIVNFKNFTLTIDCNLTHGKLNI